jgi:hypothetical protein
MKKAPGLSTGFVLGTLCLIGGIAMRIWAPDFSGFYNRGLTDPPMSFWSLLLILGVVNFIYAGFSQYIQRKANPSEIPAAQPSNEGDSTHEL